jgi:hypothetical protein
VERDYSEFIRLEERSYPVAWAKTARGWKKLTPLDARDPYLAVMRLYATRALGERPDFVVDYATPLASSAVNPAFRPA